MNKRTVVADRIVAGLGSGTPKQVFQDIAVHAGNDTGIAPATLYKKLMDQEVTSPSGIGGGIALPHLRLKNLDKPYTLVAGLKNLVPFQAVDNRPVALVCLLLSPADNVAAHLQRLSRLTRLFKDKDLRQQLRAANDRDTIQALLIKGREQQKAA